MWLVKACALMSIDLNVFKYAHFKISNMEWRAYIWNFSNFLMCPWYMVHISHLKEKGGLCCAHLVLLTGLILGWFSTLLQSLLSAWLALMIWVSISLFREPSWKIMLPRYLKVSIFASWVSSRVIAIPRCRCLLWVDKALQSWWNWRRCWKVIVLTLRWWWSKREPSR